MNYLRFGIYVAAGVGTYELLRRTGMLKKAGDWLSEQVPDDYVDQAREYAGQVRERAQDIGSQLRDRAQQAVNQAKDAISSAAGYVDRPVAAGAQNNSDGNPASSASNGRSNGQTITGPGRGVTSETEDADGTHASHRVGRGVVR